MDAWVARLRKEIEEATTDLHDLDWSRAPEGCWSSAQILEHLGRSYGTTAKMLELAVAAGPAQVRPPKFRELLARMVVVNIGFFPSGAKAPAIVTPKGDPGPIALQRALTNLDRMDAAIAAAERRWGSDGPIAMHPVLGPLTAKQWRKFHYLHGHHHMKQVRVRSGTNLMNRVTVSQ